jgi:hypothetical protein
MRRAKLICIRRKDTKRACMPHQEACKLSTAAPSEVCSPGASSSALEAERSICSCSDGCAWIQPGDCSAKPIELKDVFFRALVMQFVVVRKFSRIALRPAEPESLVLSPPYPSHTSTKSQPTPSRSTEKIPYQRSSYTETRSITHRLAPVESDGLPLPAPRYSSLRT